MSDVSGVIDVTEAMYVEVSTQNTLVIYELLINAVSVKSQDRRMLTKVISMMILSMSSLSAITVPFRQLQ